MLTGSIDPMEDLTLMIATASILAALAAMTALSDRPDDAPRPNVVIINCDDLGYADLGCYGHPSIATPNIDRMASEGQKWTQFYVGASVCTPSRTALLTGRLPVRSGMTSRTDRVLFPDSEGGIPESEITLAEALGELGYDCGMAGKWHLGHRPEFLPTNNGFDSYLGIPYSNDMDRSEEAPEGRAAFDDPRIEYFNVPLLLGLEVIERPADQRTITGRYTDEAVRFIEQHVDTPFFFYLAHTMPHVPLFRSGGFAGKSRRGLYGDVVEEIDASVGRVLEAIRSNGLADRTLVFFTSDNGPWLTFGEQGGSAGLLRDGKGSTWEGGMRVPLIAWWPGTIPEGTVVRGLGASMDLFNTSIALAGGTLPDDRTTDGYDLAPAFRGEGPSPRDAVFYYRGTELYAVRSGPFKAHFITEDAYGRDTHRTAHEPPLLYHLERDPSESIDVADGYPEVLDAIRQRAEAHRSTVTPVPNQLETRHAP